MAQAQAQHQQILMQLASGQQMLGEAQQQSAMMLAQGNAQSAAMVAEKLDALAIAFTQPRTIVKDGSGKPIGLRIGAK
jgi:hypothetical protein